MHPPAGILPTDVQRLENDERQSQKMEALGKLAGGLAHDFNNLLTVINSYADILLDSGEFSGESAEGLKQIYLAGERAANLTRQLMAVSRRQPVRLQVVDLNEIIPNLARLLTRLLGENVILKLKIFSGSALVLADTGMIEQVLLNLAVNARDAMPRGGQLTIQTQAKFMDATHLPKNPDARKGEFICVSVADTGGGLAAGLKPRLSEPLFTAYPLGQGSGRELAMVFGIVKEHRGWIDCESIAGGSTVFNVFLPMVPASLRGEALPASERDTSAGLILVVEDEEPVRALAVLILQKQGYRVLEAASAAEALEVWERHRSRIDVLITDMVMPGEMTGLELAAQLQKLKPTLSIIFATGYSADWMDDGHGAPKRYSLLQKPYRPSQLVAALRAARVPKSNLLRE